ncbi:hypothetical protein CVT26_011677 [Gymnopilus dilepis]|uniref:Uncharacterized protein n=1 Tax=Gymnopilus dilepis TaxID=231916 RepID=A0A409WC96_9AGAR|nr:hypothetical protein CVT26_011677 [Gymnopilus dilepis]
MPSPNDREMSEELTSSELGEFDGRLAERVGALKLPGECAVLVAGVVEPIEGLLVEVKALALSSVATQQLLDGCLQKSLTRFQDRLGAILENARGQYYQERVRRFDNAAAMCSLAKRNLRNRKGLNLP